MKTIRILSSVLASLAMTVSAFGSGANESAYQGALFNGDSTKFSEAVFSGGPRRVSLAVALQQQKRTLEADSGMKQEWEANHLVGTVGFDLLEWLTVYGGGGQVDLSVDNGDSGADAEWLAGAQLRLLNYLVLEPWYGDDSYWAGVNIESFVRSASAEDGRGNSMDWLEVFGSLTLSLTSKPSRAGLIDRVGLYIGPALSALSVSQDFGPDLEADQMVGFIGGLQVNPNPNMGFRLELQQFDQLGLGGSFTFHF